MECIDTSSNDSLFANLVCKLIPDFVTTSGILDSEVRERKSTSKTFVPKLLGPIESQKKMMLRSHPPKWILHIVFYVLMVMVGTEALWSFGANTVIGVPALVEGARQDHLLWLQLRLSIASILNWRFWWHLWTDRSCTNLRSLSTHMIK